MSTLPPPAEFHSGVDLDSVFVSGWANDEDFRRMKPGAVLPFRIAGNPYHNFYNQALLVEVSPEGTAHLLVDKKSISEKLYQGG